MSNRRLIVSVEGDEELLLTLDRTIAEFRDRNTLDACASRLVDVETHVRVDSAGFHVVTREHEVPTRVSEISPERLSEVESMAKFQHNPDALELIDEIRRLRKELELSNRYIDRRNERIVRDSKTISDLREGTQQ